MHEVFFVGGPRRVLLGDVFAGDESEPDELFGHQLAHLNVVVGQAHSGLQKIDCGLLHAEHRLINLALAGTEASVGGKTARHVAGVVAVDGSDVKEHHVAVVHLGVVGDVVQHAGVGARPDNGRVGKAMRTEAHKLVQEFCLKLVFPNAGLEEAQHAVVAGGGDVGSHLHDFDFFRVLDGAQGHECRRRPLVFLVGESAAQVGSKAVLSGFNGIVAANVFVAKQVGMLGMSHNLAQDAIKVAQPVNTLDSAQGTRLVFRELGTLPAGDEVVGF